MPALSRFRERLVLGHVRRSFDVGEEVLAWVHVRVPGVRPPGVLLLTDRRYIVHVASRRVDDQASSWAGLTSWRVERPLRSQARLTLVGPQGPAVSELSLVSRGGARSASRVIETIARFAEVPHDAVGAAQAGTHDAAPDGTPGAEPAGAAATEPVVGAAATELGDARRVSAPQLQAARRGVRGQARRVVVTIVGIAVLLLSAVFASPFVPGPGSLTALAGIAILAREYEWARDLYVWATRQFERFLAWMGRRRAALRRRREPEADPEEASLSVREAA